MKKKAILFDLDGTLLPMDEKAFLAGYTALIAREAAGWGYEPKEMTDALWTGTGAMVKNDGKRYNMEVFWDTFSGLVTNKTPEEVRADIPLFDAFYSGAFNEARSASRENPLAPGVVRELKDMGLRLILATYPVFPPAAIRSRLGWTGLSPESFDYITTYDNSRYCKPSADYFLEIARENGLLPEECIVVGNDIDEDIYPAIEAGMDAIVVTDRVINKGGREYGHFRCTPFAGLLEMIRGFDL